MQSEEELCEDWSALLPCTFWKIFVRIWNKVHVCSECKIESERQWRPGVMSLSHAISFLSQKGNRAHGDARNQMLLYRIYRRPTNPHKVQKSSKIGQGKGLLSGVRLVSQKEENQTQHRRSQSLRQHWFDKTGPFIRHGQKKRLVKVRKDWTGKGLVVWSETNTTKRKNQTPKRMGPITENVSLTKGLSVRKEDIEMRKRKWLNVWLGETGTRNRKEGLSGERARCLKWDWSHREERIKLNRIGQRKALIVWIETNERNNQTQQRRGQALRD